MKTKTLERIRRRFERLPLHHIDTSIILEDPKSDDGRYCERYLHLVGYKYRGVFSLPMLGELFLKIMSLGNEDDKSVALEFTKTIIQNKRIKFYTPKNIEDIITRLEDKRLEHTDKSIFACAVEDAALTLVTLDRKLIGNSRLEAFGIKIKHPKELV